MNIYDITREDLQQYFLDMGQKKFHADQLFSWCYEKRITNWDEITNIKKELIETLKTKFSLERLKIVNVEKDIDVNKYLFELEDGNKIESVLMFHDYGISICVSSQVGCNMGCKFCQSGRLKKRRNLYAYEIVEQLLLVEELCQKHICNYK